MQRVQAAFVFRVSAKLQSKVPDMADRLHKPWTIKHCKCCVTHEHHDVILSSTTFYYGCAKYREATDSNQVKVNNKFIPWYCVKPRTCVPQITRNEQCVSHNLITSITCIFIQQNGCHMSLLRLLKIFDETVENGNTFL